MNRHTQSIFRAHRRGSGCICKDPVHGGLKFVPKKGSTEQQWELAQKNKIDL